MLCGGASETRNSNIMKMFNLLGFGEHADSGVPDIFSIWREARYVEPTIDEISAEMSQIKLSLLCCWLRMNRSKLRNSLKNNLINNLKITKISK